MTASTITHPLDPLSAEEISAAVQIARRHLDLTQRARFALVALYEPEKQALLAHDGDRPMPREAELVILERATGASFRVIVSLTEGTVTRVQPLGAAQAPVLEEEWDDMQEAIRADPRFQERLRRRGITDPDEAFLAHHRTPVFDAEKGQRLWRCCTYWRDAEHPNNWAHPVEGLMATVDLDNMRVVEVWDEDEPRPLPRSPWRVEDDGGRSHGAELRALEIVQRQGPSFSIEGNEIRWQNWSLRASIHPRTGLVLHDVCIEHGGRARPVLDRAGLSEMLVPYADPSPSWFWRAPFDVGDYGLGGAIDSLELGCDCLGEIRYMDAVLADERGEPQTVRNAICVHEEDVGVLWKHFEPRLGTDEVVRNRRLVVSSIVSLNNYDYGFYWYFYLDGTIGHQVMATGIMQAQGLRDGGEPLFGTKITPELGAPYHQHIFNYRLDMTVDGRENSVYEVDAVREPLSSANPYGNAWRPVPRLFEDEADAWSDPNVATSRYWLVRNPNRLNEIGEPVGYRLLPWLDGVALGASLLTSDTPSGRAAAFSTHAVWVTHYDRDERYAAGEFTNQAGECDDGLQVWQQARRPIADDDVVVWYNVVFSHVPRPEDWPVMPAERAGFILKPDGFFDRNPALDLERPSCAPHNGRG
jgi:primary-amine oxidase